MSGFRNTYLFIAAALLMMAAQSVFAEPQNITGLASWYSERDRGIRPRTANGERFDDSKRTCASWNHKFGTYLEVTNRETGQSVVCKVNDRGPHRRFRRVRVIDLSKEAFRRIGSLHKGLVRVTIKPLKKISPDKLLD